ncbi:SDR family NAD(P)-dependent oxidoreductase [Simiduia agarivorans]|uniref:Short chain dehydrogenase n=1 Tax=Simiduia agarivorans (strain DSM 21679 / JCM 13881 / BCRC 17597 / SA1) TaxID=1117647 RepID=K4KWX2_SIMAS|nr:SDR family NAD(P)-dependent oxidoreductase [Simiduia agarivorans]AFU98442.1 short chain dehydrogenase [Simiduia agarivorans SA1 = DSM 21679]
MNRPVALVTGAASGLGWALCQQLIKAGYALALVDRDEAGLQQKAALVPPAQCALTAALDLTDRDALDALAIKLRALQRLDCLVNNAGITHRSLAEKTQPEVIAKVMAVNYQAPVELTLLCLPLLKASHGQIVNISSMAGWMPVLGRAGYCAAKSAMHQYFEVLRAEIMDDGVNVLMVYPSFLDTAIEKNALDEDGKPNARARSTIGSMRSADWMAERIATAILFREERLFPDRFTFFASVLYKICPRFFIHNMRKKFAVELNAKDAG